MRWLCVCTLQRGVLDPPEPLDEEHAKLAELSWKMAVEAEYGDRNEYWRHLRAGAGLRRPVQRVIPEEEMDIYA